MPGIDVGFYPQAQPNALFGTAQNALGVQNAKLNNQLLGTQNTQAHQDLVKGQVSYLANGLGALASKADLSSDDMHAFGARAVQEGIIDPRTYQAEMAAVDAAGGDPGKLRALATNYALRALDAGKQFDAQFGSPSMINAGNTQTPVTVSPLTGIHPIGAPIQNTLTPQDLAATAPLGVNANNQTISGTKGQQLTELGMNPLTAQPSAQSTNPLMGTQPGAGGGPAPAAPVPLAAASNGSRGILTTPVPGAVEAQTEVGGNSGKQYSADLAQAANFQQSTLPLQKAIPALEALGTTGTGPGTEQINQMKSFLLSMGVGEAAGIDPNDVKGYDEAKKYLTQFVNQNGNTGTNDKLAASFAGNPSTEISNAAAVDVAKTALSLSRLQNAQVRAFAATGKPADQYSSYAKDFNASQDPRAYGLDLMKPEQRAELIASLKGPERAKFAASLRQAMALGLVAPPQGASGGQ